MLLLLVRVVALVVVVLMRMGVMRWLGGRRRAQHITDVQIVFKIDRIIVAARQIVAVPQSEGFVVDLLAHWAPSQPGDGATQQASLWVKRTKPCVFFSFPLFFFPD